MQASCVFHNWQLQDILLLPFFYPYDNGPVEPAVSDGQDTFAGEFRLQELQELSGSFV